MESKKMLTILVLVSVLMCCQARVSEAVPMGTAWTYQGRLIDDNQPASGEYDFEFRLFDANEAGNQKGPTIDFNDLEVFDGYFTVELDFGSNVFDGNAVWLETTVAQSDGSDPCTLWPRTEITPVPYALQTRGIFVDDDGIVGIGGTPDTALTGYKEAALDIIGPGTKYKTIQFTDSDNNKKWQWSHRPAAGENNDFQLYHYNGATWHPYMSVNTAGNVGIGTTIPEDTLHVNGSFRVSNPYSLLKTGSGTDFLRRGGDDGVWYVAPFGTDTSTNVVVVGGGPDDGQTVAFQTVSSAFLATENGNVRIGTTSPTTAKLDVVSSTDYCLRSEASNTADVENYGGYFTAAGKQGRGIYGEASFTSTTMHSQPFPSTYGGYFVAKGYVYRPGTPPLYPIGTGIYAKGSKYAAELDGRVIIHGGTTIDGNLTIRNWTGTSTLIELGEGLDYAEGFDVSDNKHIAAGSVLIIDAHNPGKLALSNKAYDSKVAGIVAGAKDQGSGVRLGAGQFDYDVALAGRVYCNVDAMETAVEPGDLLTTSPTPGYAMKATDYMRAQGAILGKAMESLEQGKKAQILVLVTLQ